MAAFPHAKVFQNFELLENVLLHATAWEILVATSVCTTWRAVVENSKDLRAYLVTLPARKPSPHRKRDSAVRYKLNDSETSPWHFMVKTTNNRPLFILRLPSENVEVYLLAPLKYDTHLKVLDSAYDMYAVRMDYRAVLEFRLKSGEKVCRTKSNAIKQIQRDTMMRQVRPTGVPVTDSLRCTGGFGDILRRYLMTFYNEDFKSDADADFCERPLRKVDDVPELLETTRSIRGDYLTENHKASCAQAESPVPVDESSDRAAYHKPLLALKSCLSCFN